MCVHLWPGMDPGAVEAFGDGLAAARAAGWVEVAADELCPETAVEEVEALAMLSPNARVAPSTAPPTAVPMSGLVILTRFSFRWCPPGPRPDGAGDPCAAAIGWGGPGDPVLRRAVCPGRAGRPASSQYARPA